MYLINLTSNHLTINLRGEDFPIIIEGETAWIEDPFYKKHKIRLKFVADAGVIKLVSDETMKKHRVEKLVEIEAKQEAPVKEVAPILTPGITEDLGKKQEDKPVTPVKKVTLAKRGR